MSAEHSIKISRFQDPVNPSYIKQHHVPPDSTKKPYILSSSYTSPTGRISAAVKCTRIDCRPDAEEVRNKRGGGGSGLGRNEWEFAEVDQRGGCF